MRPAGRGDDLATVSKSSRSARIISKPWKKIVSMLCRGAPTPWFRPHLCGLSRLRSGRVVERFKAEIAGRGDDSPTSRSSTMTNTPPAARLEDHRRVCCCCSDLWRLSLIVPAADKMLRQPVAPVPAHLASEVRAARTAASPPPATPRPQQPPRLQPQGHARDAACGRSATAAAAFPQGQVYGKQYPDARVILRVHQIDARSGARTRTAWSIIDRTLNPGDTLSGAQSYGLTLTTPRCGRGGSRSRRRPHGLCGWKRRNRQKLCRSIRKPLWIANRCRVRTMSLSAYRDIHRRKSRQITVGKVRSAATRRSPCRP